MHSPVSTQAFAHLRDASGPSPGFQDVDDAGDDRDRLGLHAAGPGDRADLDAFAAAGAGIGHRRDPFGQRGFECGGHAGATFRSPDRAQITASAGVDETLLGASIGCAEQRYRGTE